MRSDAAALREKQKVIGLENVSARIVVLGPLTSVTEEGRRGCENLSGQMTLVGGRRCKERHVVLEPRILFMIRLATWRSIASFPHIFQAGEKCSIWCVHQMGPWVVRSLADPACHLDIPSLSIHRSVSVIVLHPLNDREPPYGSQLLSHPSSRPNATSARRTRAR